MGTPTYMAPEQCRGVTIDHRADLYSLGCILFEMVCGTPPFRGEGAGDVLAAHIHLAPPMPRALAGHIPPSLDALIQRLLAKPPDARPATAGHLVAEIDGLIWSAMPPGVAPVSMPSSPGPRSAATTLSGSTGVTEVTQRPARRARAIAAAAGTVIVAGIAALLLVGSGTDPAPIAAAVAPSEPAAPPPPAAAQPAQPAPAQPAQPAPAPVAEAAPAAPANPTVDIDVTSTPVGAEVFVDGALLGRTPYRGAIPRAARATLLLRLGGYSDTKVVVSAESPIRKDLALKKKARVPTSRNPF
jgi:eukaryotic-like serine/threonine-protein kinase